MQVVEDIYSLDRYVHLFKIVKIAITQILREINFEEFRSAKSAILTLLEALKG